MDGQNPPLLQEGQPDAEAPVNVKLQLNVENWDGNGDAHCCSVVKKDPLQGGLVGFVENQKTK